MDSWLSSALIPTLLMAIGLFFFIRAATKDRIEELELRCTKPIAEIDQLTTAHLQARQYAITKAEDSTKRFDGQVRPSWFLAIFLSILAAIGFGCIGLIFATAIPQLANLSIGIVALSPLAGVFYWQKAGKAERVVIALSPTETGSCLTAIGHRDELNVLRQALRSQNVLA